LFSHRFNELAENHEEIIKFKDAYKARNAELEAENKQLKADNKRLFSGNPKISAHDMTSLNVFFKEVASFYETRFNHCVVLILMLRLEV